MSLHGILGGAIKCLDAQVLFDPFEKEFHLPALPIQVGDGGCGEDEIVGEKHKCFATCRVEVADAPQLVGIVFSRIVSFEDDNLVALDTR